MLATVQATWTDWSPFGSRAGRYGILLTVLVALLLVVPVLAEHDLDYLATALGYPVLLVACGMAVDAGTLAAMAWILLTN